MEPLAMLAESVGPDVVHRTMIFETGLVVSLPVDEAGRHTYVDQGSVDSVVRRLQTLEAHVNGQPNRSAKLHLKSRV